MYNSIKILKEIVIDLMFNGFYPFRLTSLEDEEGLCLAFKDDNILAYLEIYNDGDIGLIAENINERKTIFNEDLTKENIVLTLKRIFEK